MVTPEQNRNDDGGGEGGVVVKPEQNRDNDGGGEGGVVVTAEQNSAMVVVRVGAGPPVSPGEQLPVSASNR